MDEEDTKIKKSMTESFLLEADIDSGDHAGDDPRPKKKKNELVESNF